MDKIKLKANTRTLTGKKARKLRSDGLILAVLYGKRKGNINLTVTNHDFRKLYKENGTSSIVLLEIEGEGQKNVLIQDIDFDPITGDFRHLDFYEVSMTEKITATVPLKFVGDSKAMIEQGGTLATNKDEVEVECLPSNLPREIEVDISVLSDFETAIHISDLMAPEGVEIKDEPEEMIATVEPPRSEEEMAELEEPVEEAKLPEEEGEAEVELGSQAEGATEEKTE